MQKVFVSTAVNDDIDYLAWDLYEECSGPGKVMVTHRASQIRGAGEIRKTLFSRKATSGMQLVNLALIVWEVFRVWRARGKPDEVIVTSPSPVNIVLLPLLGYILRIKLKACVHDVTPHYGGLRGILYYWQNRIIFGLAREVYVYSQFSRRLASQRFGFPEARIVVRPLRSPVEAVEVGDVLPAPEARRYDCVWWGRPEDYKGRRQLPTIARGLAARGKTMLVISRFKKFDPVYARLRAMANVTVVVSRLPLQELIQKLVQARANICPYESASQSGIIPFCAAIGLPSVVYDVGALREQIEELDCGRVVREICSPESLEYMESLSENDYERIRARYRERFGRLGTSPVFEG